MIKLDPLKEIGKEEADAAFKATLYGPLSGYLGGQRHGGGRVEKLEKEWAGKFGVKYAISCNSATSGILIACMAIGVKGRTVRTTPYTMSGTAAPAALLGADVVFGDIDPETYCLETSSTVGLQKIEPFPVTIIANLFGHPAELQPHPGRPIIEDAAQSILATRNGKLAGDATVTVFSGNVHKQIQCGEGGMCCTNDDVIAYKMAMARNHGELAGHAVGLNLRLSEIHAAIWYEQLKKADKIIARRVEIAEQLSEMAKDLGQVPVVKPGCTHSYYIWALKMRSIDASRRAERALQAEGIPIRRGYVTPLYLLPAFKQNIKREVVENTNATILIYENCAYDPSSAHLKQMAEALKRVTECSRNPDVKGP